MHSSQVRDRVQELCGAGANDCEVARVTGLARSTVREMRLQSGRDPGPRSLVDGRRCPRCWQAARRCTVSAPDHSELLGLYLGDRHVVLAGRAHRLRLFLDSKYTNIVDEAEALLERCFVDNSIGRQLVHGGTMTVLSVYSRHLPCLFPQHGPGPKHRRPIRLEPWQRTIVSAEPWPLLRGLIRSDGCSFINRTGPYEYLSFHFANRSDGIARIFEEACDQVGVRYRSNLNQKRRIWEIRINRRRSVALMCDHVGVKR